MEDTRDSIRTAIREDPETPVETLNCMVIETCIRSIFTTENLFDCNKVARQKFGNYCTYIPPEHLLIPFLECYKCISEIICHQFNAHIDTCTATFHSEITEVTIAQMVLQKYKAKRIVIDKGAYDFIDAPLQLTHIRDDGETVNVFRRIIVSEKISYSFL